MMIERLISGFLSVLVGGFATAWLGIMVSAAAAVPVVGFVGSIAAALVVYAVKSAAEGREVPEDDGLILI